ncbi:hypothetical protein CKO28_17400 [Rhodovibrio sodomensis]|uniref:HTH cro/C1-type domain-containing protein n=2 Tax=Rhodovibrio sodomensis TaxID=1088 RepID=A0ABS1DJ52_9PROT|nr:hypothetical protein [Rhodovibrio sodomensis]
MANAAARLKAGESLASVAEDMGETSAVLVRKLKAVNADFIPQPKAPERYHSDLSNLLSEASSASAADVASRHGVPEWAVWHHLAEERRRATAPFRDAIDRWQELHGLDNSAAAAELGAPSGVAFRNWRSGSAFPPSSAVERLCRDLGIDDPSRVDPRAGLAQEREGALARQSKDIRAWRERFGLSAKAARERFGCSKMTWWRWENAVVPANAGVMEKVRSELRGEAG